MLNRKSRFASLIAKATFRNIVCVVVLINAYGFGSNAQAGDITWGTPTAVSTAIGNSSDVSTNGTLVEAYNGVANDLIDAATPLIVNGVTFTPTTSLLDADPKTSGATLFSSLTDSGDLAYDNLLDTLEYGGGGGLVTLTVGDGDGDGSVTGAGLLTTGGNYEIQAWFVDTRPNQDDRVMTFGDGNGNVAHLNDQFSIGTFTATGTTQTLTLNSGDAGGGGPNFGQSHINAYQIRALPVPEPTSLAMLGLLAGVGIFVRRRR